MRIRVVGQAGEALFPFNDSGPWAKFRDILITRKDVLVTQKFGQKIGERDEENDEDDDEGGGISE